MVDLRPATAADDRTIRRMVAAEGLDPTALNWPNFLVAEADGHVVGIGQIRQHHDCRELGSLIVLKTSQGKGVGGQIIRALEARTGYPLYLFCNSPLETYYQRFGFTRIALRDVPPSIRWKVLLSYPLRLFGIRIRVMRKTASSHGETFNG